MFFRQTTPKATFAFTLEVAASAAHAKAAKAPRRLHGAKKSVEPFHAGCPVCVSAEKQLLAHLDPDLKVDVVHLGEQAERLAEAERVGVVSVPALVIDETVLHINFGAALSDLKAEPS